MSKTAELIAEKKAAKKRNKVKKMLKFDYTLFFIVVFILAFGLVMLYSTTAYGAALKKGSSLYYLKRQLAAAILGFAGMIFFVKVDYHIWKPFAFPLYLASVVMCVAVIFIGNAKNGSSRWFSIMGISVQPSEFAKIGTILFLSLLISSGASRFRDFKETFKTLVTFVAPAVLVVAYNNLSTGVIILGIAIIMFFVAAPQYRQFFLIGGGLVLFVIIFINMEGYRASRIDAWLHPENYTSGTAYQTLQALYAIGSGGLFGKGLGGSMQKYIVPEAQNDMIFSIICEELGIFGAMCIILLYILLLYRLLYIANHAKDLFGAYLCVGIMAHYALQVFLNIAVVTNTFPNTGVTLPLVSYGGSALVILLCEIGLALSVSKNMKFEDEI